MVLESAHSPPAALPPGCQLCDYRIEQQISVGGFSVVYWALDSKNQRVVIKEYLPSKLARRDFGESVPSVLDEHVKVFRYGMRCFFEEGRALSRLDHPNVVRVLNFFRANETAYMVMQYEAGCALHQYLWERQRPVSEVFIRKVFSRVLNGLREVHAARLLHLDLKPANIYLRKNGTPLLIDFGAARQTLWQDAPLLKPMYTPGFASPEHYKHDCLGPWSDIYSIGATMYACIAHGTPQPADTRQKKDLLLPAKQRWEGRYSSQLLATIDQCLSLNYLDRPQSVLTLQKALTQTVAVQSVVNVAPQVLLRLRNLGRKFGFGLWRR